MNVMNPSSQEHRLEQALEYGRNRNYRQAALLLEGIVCETDSPPAALLYLGRSYHALGEYARAASMLQGYLRTGVSGEEGYFFLGRSYLALGFYTKAAAAFRKALDINEHSHVALMYLAYASLKRGDTEGALALFGRAVEGNPEDRQLYAGYLNTLFIQGIKEFQKENLELSKDMLTFVEEKGGDSLLLHLYLGLLERDIGSVDKALEHYNKAVASRPEDPSIRFQRAEVLLMAERTDEAFQELSSLANKSDQDFPVDDILSLQRLLAVTLYKGAQYRRAIHFAVKVLKHGPEVDMHLLIGEGYRHLEDFEKAENHFLRASELLPGSIEPLYGQAMLRWQQNDCEGMIPLLRKIDRVNPGDSVASYYQALCISRLNYPAEQTIPLLQSEIEKSEPDAYLFAALGGEYLKLEDSEQGEVWFSRALEVNPDMLDAYLGLIDTYRHSGDDKKLIDILEKYLKDRPSDAEMIRLLIQILLRNELYARAIPLLEGYLVSAPGDINIQRALAYCLRHNHNFREAAVIYRRLLSGNPRNERFLTSLVYCLSRSDKTDEAISLLEKAIAFLSSPSASLYGVLSKLYLAAERLDDAIRSGHEALDRDTKNCDLMLHLSILYREKGIDEFAERYKKNAEKCFRKKSCDNTT